MFSEAHGLLRGPDEVDVLSGLQVVVAGEGHVCLDQFAASGAHKNAAVRAVEEQAVDDAIHPVVADVCLLIGITSPNGLDEFGTHKDVDFRAFLNGGFTGGEKLIGRPCSVSTLPPVASLALTTPDQRLLSPTKPATNAVFGWW